MLDKETDESEGEDDGGGDTEEALDVRRDRTTLAAIVGNGVVAVDGATLSPLAV